MNGAVVLHIITYAAIATFLLVCVVRFIRVFSMPMHVRWELYPVPHEGGERAKYGGSALEELDWWTKPKNKSMVDQMKAMFLEMVLLEALFEHNRKLWYRSFPFHFGLYVLIGGLGLIVAGAVLENGITISMEPGVNPLGTAIYYLTPIVMVVGLILGTLGTLGLIQRRLFDRELADYTSPAARFNLLFFLVVFVVAWLTFIIADPMYTMTRSYVWSLLTFDLSHPAGHALLAIEVILAVALIAYIPMTHMAHFFIKWFTWDRIRWDDEPNFRGSKIEAKVIEQVQYPVTWSAAHINADGKKNWVDIATEEMEK